MDVKNGGGPPFTEQVELHDGTRPNALRVAQGLVLGRQRGILLDEEHSLRAERLTSCGDHGGCGRLTRPPREHEDEDDERTGHRASPRRRSTKSKPTSGLRENGPISVVSRY